MGKAIIMALVGVLLTMGPISARASLRDSGAHNPRQWKTSPSVCLTAETHWLKMAFPLLLVGAAVVLASGVNKPPY